MPVHCLVHFLSVRMLRSVHFLRRVNLVSQHFAIVVGARNLADQNRYVGGAVTGVGARTLY